MVIKKTILLSILSFIAHNFKMSFLPYIIPVLAGDAVGVVNTIGNSQPSNPLAGPDSSDVIHLGPQMRNRPQGDYKSAINLLPNIANVDSMDDRDHMRPTPPFMQPYLDSSQQLSDEMWKSTGRSRKDVGIADILMPVASESLMSDAFIYGFMSPFWRISEGHWYHKDHTQNENLLAEKKWQVMSEPAGGTLKDPKYPIKYQFNAKATKRPKTKKRRTPQSARWYRNHGTTG
jgi:hypothetical protein